MEISEKEQNILDKMSIYIQKNNCKLKNENLNIMKQKFNEEIKIKDLIPNGFELNNIYFNDDNTAVSINWKPKIKKFDDYVKKYMLLPTIIKDNYTKLACRSSMKNKLGLLWYIVNDNDGDLNDFADILKLMKEGVKQLSSVDTHYEIYEILPLSFIQSIKK